jgi:quinol monooxygenase YgiN
MYARSTEVLAHPESIDAGIRSIRDEVLPMLLGLEGCIGLSMLADRNSGRCIMTSAWETAATMHASERAVRPYREHVSEMLGNRPQVDEWEIAVLHRDHTSRAGACVRASWVRMGSDQAEGVTDVYRSTLLPVMQDFEGFCSASLMIDHESGYAVSSLTFDSFEAMQRSRERACSLRQVGAREAGVEVVEAREFELAVAHLRVPELV